MKPVQLRQEGPTLFFKYQKISKHSLANLEADQLWYSTVDKFNDPFEFMFKVVNGIPAKEQKDMIEYFLDCGVVCLATHKSLIEDQMVEDRSLHPDNMLMWAHYGDNHYGFCLGLRKKAIIYPVIYQDDFPTIDLSSEMPIEYQVFKALHTKQACWSYEFEYRALNTIARNKPIPCEGTYELERVYFGLRTPDKDIQDVKAILKGKEIAYYRAKLVNDKFLIEFYPD